MIVIPGIVCGAAPPPGATAGPRTVNTGALSILSLLSVEGAESVVTPVYKI
jgi:hypothetical protein